MEKKWIIASKYTSGRKNGLEHIKKQIARSAEMIEKFINEKHIEYENRMYKQCLEVSGYNLMQGDEIYNTYDWIDVTRMSCFISERDEYLRGLNGIGLKNG